MRRCRNIGSFTLVEMVVVTAIIALIMGIAFARLRPKSATMSAENAILEIESFFTLAGRVAAVQGKTIRILYSREERRFSIVDSAPDDKISGNREYLSEKYRTLRLPDNVILTGRESGSENLAFRCFADGTAAGPEMLIEAHGEIHLLKLSPLTGNIQKKRR